MRLPRGTTSEPPKVARTCGVLYILTSKCASRHNSVHLFDISTSKSAPNPSIVYTFDFEMCFVPQRCALFRHLNFQKCSEPVSFLDFCASCQNGVQKCSEPEMFVHFDLEMCFAPLRRAIFHLSSGQLAPHPPL